MTITALPEQELFDTTHMWTPVEFDQGAHDHIVDAYRHDDGSITYIVVDMDGEHCNPREWDNLAILIQENDRSSTLDTDDADLTRARKRFDCYGRRGTSAHGYAHGTRVRLDREAMMQRYLAIFRPDVLYYEDRWGAGRESYGWGYILADAWRRAMFPLPHDGATVAQLDAFLRMEAPCTPKEAFDSEVKVYGEWCEGEVYGFIHEHPDGTDDSCWGFLGYDDHKDIAAQATDSPITETLY